jgi:hypothetical protein
VRFRAWLAAALLGTTLLAACRLGPVDSVHRLDTGPFDSTRVLLELEQLWYATGSQSGGFGYVVDLEATPSLYSTAWHLRAATAAGVALPELSRDQSAAWLTSVIDGSGAFQGISRLESIQLAVQALRDLGVEPPKHTAAALEELRKGDLYANNAGSEPSWAATALAMEALLAAGLTPPRGLAAAVRAGLPLTTASSSTPDAWLNLLLPQWALADQLLSPSERTPLRASLAAELGRAHEAVLAAPLGEVTIFVMAELVTIARANGLAGLDFSEPSWQALETPAGYLATAIGDPRPSMFNTYYAGVLGYRPGPHLADYLRYSAAPRGWRMDVGPPDVKASFYALQVSRALGRRDHEPALRGQAALWLEEAAAALANPAGRQSFDGVYFAVLLAKALGLAPSAGVAQALSLLTEERQGEVPDSAVVSLARVCSAVGCRPGSRFTARLRGLLPKLDLGHMAEVASAHDVAALLQDSAVLEHARQAAARLRLGSVYLTREGAPVGDLRSTAIGTMVAGVPAAPKSIAATFADSRGFWLLPARESTGNTVDPETLYLGLWLFGMPVDTGGIL